MHLEFDKLFSQILIEQQKFDSLKKSDPKKLWKLKIEKEKFTKRCGFPPILDYFSSGKGHGPFIELVDGSVKYDLNGGSGTNLLGHSHPLCIRAHLESSMESTIMGSNLIVHKKCNDFCQNLLSQVKNTKLDRFWFSPSGSMANDLASQIIFHDKNSKSRLIALEGSFAGKSTMAGHISHFDAQNNSCFLPVDYISSSENVIEELQGLWNKHKNNLKAIFIELVQNKSGNFILSIEKIQSVIKWAKEHSLIIWVDEVQSFGRTKKLFACDYFDILSQVDIITLGKSLHVSGILYSSQLNFSKELLGGTSCGSLSSINFADKTLTYLINGNFYGENGKINKIENQFRQRIEAKKHTCFLNPISDIQLIGTFMSFSVGDGNANLNMKFIKKLFENGIISFMNGTNKKNVFFLIPLAILEEHIDEICTIVEKTANTEL